MYISSDSNIWFDFYSPDRFDHPFRLGYELYISRAAFDEELVEPTTLRTALLEHGLQVADVQDDELATALSLQQKHKRLSVHDSIALAIAKHRGWVLLTGDKPLTNAAKEEKVECHGTIWVYDQLIAAGKITPEEKRIAMDGLIELVLAGKRRLPLEELRKRRG